MNNALKEKLKLVADKIGMEIEDNDIEQLAVSLTEEQISSIASSLESNRSESSKNLLLLPSNNGGTFTKEYNDYINKVREEYENKEFKATVRVDENGLEHICMVKEADCPEIIPEGTLDVNEIFNNQVSVNETKVISDIKNDMNISDDEAALVLNIIRTNFEDDSELFSKLPETIKNIIIENVPPRERSAKILNKFAIFMLHELKKSLVIEQQVIDLNESIRKEMQMEGLGSELIESFKEETLKKFNMVKEAAEKVGNKHKAQQIQRSIDSYIDTHTFDRLRKVTRFNIGKKRYTKKKFLEEQAKYVHVYCTEFNNRYKNHKYKIDDITSIIPIIRKVMPDILLEDIHKFIVLFCMYCRTLKVDRIEDHIFMYYTIKNILFLYDIHNGDESEFFKEVTTSFRAIVEYINE